MLLLLLSTLELLLPFVFSCQDEFDCSLGGQCKDNKCECDSTWTSDDCSVLHLLPSPNAKALYRSYESSWGGSVVYNSESDTFHMYAADMAYDCGLNAWQTNSRVLHATSKTAIGPYEPKEVTVPIWAHNPTLHKVPNGGPYVIYHIGNAHPHDGPPVNNCANGTTPQIDDILLPQNIVSPLFSNLIFFQKKKKNKNRK